MSRNPVASYTMRGFRMGAVDFKDFLWEALLDPAANVTMGDTAENLARQYQITRPQVDAFAAQSFERALAAQRAGFFAGEITPVRNERFERQGYQPRELKLRGTKELATDTHVRPSPLEALASIRPAFGGVQTGGNSSAIVDGAAAALVASSDYARKRGKPALARIVAGATVGVPPEIMGIGPVPAIKARARARRSHAGGYRPLRDQRSLRRASDGVRARARHSTRRSSTSTAARSPSAIRWAPPACGSPITLARELSRARLRYGIASACIGGGQGIALLIENPDATPARKN